MIFWKKTFSVFLGVLSSQVISVLGSIAITAICLPEHFGFFSSWFGIVTILSVAFTLRYEALFVVYTDKESQKEVVENTIWISTFVSMLVLPATAIGCLFLIENEVVTIKYISATGAGFLISFNMIFQSWAAARGDYRLLNILRVAFAGSTILFQIFIGLMFKSGFSLVVGFVIGLLVSAFISVLMSPKLRWFPVWHRFNHIWSFVISHKRFPLFSLPADLVSSLSASLPVILTYEKFGAESSGFLALTVRILAGPLGLLGKAILDVFKKEASAQFAITRDCRQIYKQTFLVLFFFAILFMLFAYLLIDQVFLFMYGSEWILSAKIGKVLLVMFCLQLVASPLSYIVYIAQKQQFDLVWQLGLLLVTFCSFSFSSSFWTSLQVYCVGAVFMYVIYIVMNYYFSYEKERK